MNGSFSATTHAAQYYDTGARYTTAAACQGARIRDDGKSHKMVGVLGIPSLANVDWHDKTITAVTLRHIKATHTTTANYCNFFRLYRSKKTNYENVRGSLYLDETGGYTDITIDSVGNKDYTEHSANLSAANIAWLQAQIKAGYTWFCIYYDESARSGFSAHFASASSWVFDITYAYSTYTVSYNKGSYGTGTNTTATKTYGVDLTLAGALFSRTGYTQTGWATSDGGAKVYDLGGTYAANAAITLYPVWTLNQYTVSYKKGANGSGTETTATKSHFTNLTLLGALFTRAGYTQTGWSTTDGGAKVYDLGGTYSTEAAVNLYPYWTINTFQVSYKKGSLGTGTEQSATKTYGVNLTLAGALFTRTGYEQTGWSTTDGGAKSYDLGGTYALNAAVTLYPVWSPSYATITDHSLVSKTETMASISFAADFVLDYIWYSTDNGSTWTGVNITDGTSGAYTITGLSANTTYNIKTRVRRKDSQMTTDSAALSVTTYAYPYCNSAPDFSIGDELTLGLYNPLGRTVNVILVGADNTEHAGGQVSGTQISGFATAAFVTWLYGTIPSAQSGSYRVKVKYGSTNTSNVAGGTYAIKASECLPSIGTVSYVDTAAAVIAITGNNQKIVRQHSVVRYTAATLAAARSASVVSCSVKVNGQTYALTLSGSTATGGNAAIDSAYNVKAVFTVTDSRGLTATKELTVTMLDWTLPSAIITLLRQNNYYTATDIKVDAMYSYIDGHNACSISYKCRKTGTSTYTVTGTLSDNVTATLQLDNSFAWDVVITLVDSFGGTTTYYVQLSRGMPMIFFDRLLSSVGINCFPTKTLSMEVNGVDLTAHDGESLTLSGMFAGGCMASTSKAVFSVPLPKFVTGLTPSVTALKLNIRTAAGGFLLSGSYVSGGYNVLNDNTLSVSVTLSSANVLTVEITKTSAWSVTNNTPLSVEINNMTLSFS